MNQGPYPYPPDEFDDVDPSAGPRGAHRRPRSRWATITPYLAALVASAAVAYVVIGFLWDERGTTPSSPETAAVGEPTPGPEGAPGTDAPAPGADPTAPGPTDTAAPDAPAPEPDLGTPVIVLNSTSVTGLASEAAADLVDAGWTAVRSGNFPGGTLPESTVRYASADLEPSARAVADALGIAAVELAESDATDGIEVVLEADFAG